MTNGKIYVQIQVDVDFSWIVVNKSMIAILTKHFCFARILILWTSSRPCVLSKLPSDCCLCLKHIYKSRPVQTIVQIENSTVSGSCGFPTYTHVNYTYSIMFAVQDSDSVDTFTKGIGVECSSKTQTDFCSTVTFHTQQVVSDTRCKHNLGHLVS